MMDKELEEKMGRRWKRFQEALGYTDEEMAIFRSDPRKVRAMERAPKFVTHNIIAECIMSRHCNARHKVGDKIIMDGNGVMLRDQCPERICYGVMQCVAPFVAAIWERFSEDLDDPNLFFDKVRCPDIGIENGGWGETMWRVYTEPKNKSA